MHGSIHIHRFSARHQVADADAARVARAAQQQLLDGELEAALAAVGSGDELVLVKQLSAQVRLSSASADRDNARRWSEALAQSLMRALQHAPAQHLLRYAHRRQALLAFVADALQGRDARDWAWQQLALLPATRERRNSDVQRHQALLRLLADDDQDSVPLLRVLLHHPIWPALVAHLEEAELRGLAQSVLARLAGTSARGFDEVAQDLPLPAAAAPIGAADTWQADAAPAAPRWLAPTAAAAQSAPRLRWALRLACLLERPALAARGGAAVDAQLRAWTGSSRAAAGAAPAPACAPAAPPVARRAPSSNDEPAVAAQAHGRTTPTPAPADTRTETSASGHTECGGLLFLLPLLPTCGALALLQDAAVWPPASLPQALHRLALQLWPLSADDAAALAFAGLPPDSAPPPALQASPAQLAALQEAQRLLLDDLAERVPDWQGPALLARLLRRAALISADPGWIDVTLQLREVSLEIRRAALDLDPGFLPWLGLVLRFRYE